MLQPALHHPVQALHLPPLERDQNHAFAIAQNALVAALCRLRAEDGNLQHAMANTRRALDAIQDLRQLIQ